MKREHESTCFVVDGRVCSRQNSYLSRWNDGSLNRKSKRRKRGPNNVEPLSLTFILSLTFCPVEEVRRPEEGREKNSNTDSRPGTTHETKAHYSVGEVFVHVKS
ncbi:hypothetical protein L798_12350 [Zootermopsis nevadensis]|uniref:Uncharacterized protein n=1 Tax=Zootermopsis nevadensis TaxID=136037 RepID=A0A067QGQ9_ZOONE|nr:hypothetical protein L798_12350 [Zootermopsis nevadensis]